jgi:hypothetical protein
MPEALAAVRDADGLRQFVHQLLCSHENLMTEQFGLQESSLLRRGVTCGVQFSISGPRNVRLAAVWAMDHNTLYLYNTRGERFMKLQLIHRIDWAPRIAAV